MLSVAPEFILCTDFYEEEVEKNLTLSEEFDTPAEAEFYWKHKFNPKYRDRLYHTDWCHYLPHSYVRVPAPMEQQPYWKYINCLEFTRMRVDGMKPSYLVESHSGRVLGVVADEENELEGLRHASKLKDPRTHGLLAQLTIPPEHWASVLTQEGLSQDHAQLVLGKRLYINKLMSWLKPTESDKALYDFVESGMKGTPPKGWHDEYLFSANLCPLEPGEYMWDGEYWGGGDEERLYMGKISDPHRLFDLDGKEIDGW